jgi:hypothetical protein
LKRPSANSFLVSAKRTTAWSIAFVNPDCSEATSKSAPCDLTKWLNACESARPASLAVRSPNERSMLATCDATWPSDMPASLIAPAISDASVVSRSPEWLD